MTADEWVGQIEAAVEHALAGEGVKAWEDSIPIQQDCIRLLLKRQPMQGCNASNAQACQAKIEASCDKLIAACNAPRGEEAGKLFPGDGSFLVNLATFIKTVLPLIIAFIPK